MKKWLCILFAALMLLPSGCEKTEDKNAGSDHYKVAVVTGEAAYSEAVFEAERMAEKYDYVVTKTYKNERDEDEAVSIVSELCDDENVRAIVFIQAANNQNEAGNEDKSYKSLCAAIDKVKEKRDDMLFIVGTNTEDAPNLAEKVDLCMAQDLYTMGTEIVNEAYRMGARHFIHYTFARHLLSWPVLRRREIMIKRCEELGIEFMDVTVPDSAALNDGGAEARTFVEEDVPEQVGNYGPGTAFFATDCTVHAAMIKTVMECGAIYPQPCCPGPFHGFTSALDIDAGTYDDPDAVLRQIAEKVAEYGATGHMSTWAVSSDCLTVQAGTEYAIRYLDGAIENRADMDKMQEIFDEVTHNRCKMRKSDSAENCFYYLCDYYMF